jgi:ankyrin repeat protein
MLMEACCAGQREIVRELLTAGADINAESESRNTPLIYASTAGKLECVQELLKHSQIQVRGCLKSEGKVDRSN